MILPIQQQLRARIAEAVRQVYALEPADPVLLDIPLETPPNRALGDVAVPLAFALARRLRKAPRVIAQELASALSDVPGIPRVEAAPNGYLNFFLDRAAWLRHWSSERPELEARTTGEKVVVEHTAINPNKAAHIGHLRNAALGDAFGRLLRFQGKRVEIQNYIDDTGVQVADVVVGFRQLENRTFDAVRALAESTRFDYYCWDLYARVTDWYEADKERLSIRAETLHAIEHGGNDAAAMGAFIAERIVRCHLATMRRMNIRYDLLTWEGDILRLHFWAHAFEFLKRSGEVFRQTEGKLAGCWVMRIDEDAGAEGTMPASEDTQEEQREKVIVRSDGTVTYVGKDMANQMWKFGVLGKDFCYRVFDEYAGEPPLWSTTADRTAAAASPPEFGHAATVCNVIDTRQSYLQKLLKQALSALGFKEQARHSIHYSYEMVALSHATAHEFGYGQNVDESRPFVEVSGRRGLGVKADDLLDRLTDKASQEVARRNPEFVPEEVRRTASAIAIAAVRYFMVKFSRGKVIVFDVDEALSFEGESGPYLQYAAVRAANIFAKLKDREGLTAESVLESLSSVPADAIADGSEDANELWALVLESARLDEIVDQAVRTLELSVLAKWAFALAQQFNGFYHRFPVLAEERKDVRLWRAAAVAYYRRQLTAALELMGCAVPDRM
ncbi:MAG TPA: arginine--tRNA ligase [Vicinamibacterales bacterium]|nr:arginine--tRNA ligase [Vicinamibacterales bacterium]